MEQGTFPNTASARVLILSNTPRLWRQGERWRGANERVRLAEVLQYLFTSKGKPVGFGGSLAGNSLRRAVSTSGMLLFIFLSAIGARAADWPCWGGRPSRNMASETEKGLPDWFSLGRKNAKGEVDSTATKNIKWVAKLGPMTFGSPVVSQGRVFIGTTGDSGKDAILLCLDEKTGHELGRFRCRSPQSFGVCSTPAVEGDRLYFVTPHPEVMCVDLKSWLNPGAATHEIEPAQHIVWRYDMEKILNVKQEHVASCSVLIHGNFVYVCTGNGRHLLPGFPFSPLTPSLIVLNKHSGQLVARDDEQIGEGLWRGHWTSPSLAMVNGKPQILFAAGNGYCYAFEPVDPAVKVIPDRWTTTTLRGPIVHFIDVKDKDTAGLSPAEYARKFNVIPSTLKPALPLEFRYSFALPSSTPVDSVPAARVPDVPVLKKIWWFDYLPPEYRNAPFYVRMATGDGKKHPCEIISTPVYYRNRVYVPIGGDPNHGLKNSMGYLVCIDPTKTGDITRSGKVWSYDELKAAFSTLAVADGLVFVIDDASVVHCLDAESGRKYWTYRLTNERDLMSSSLLVADGKVFVGKSVLALSKSLKILGAIAESAASSSSTPCVANGVLYTVMGRSLWAVCDKGDKRPADTPQPVSRK